ncbi:chlorohydrolase [Leptolinea sp. HRD-7]|nr:chlorohydrolase [Leptolinea sp. HRD-7]
MLITNGIVITWEDENRVLEGYAVRVEGSKITHVDKQSLLLEKFPHDEILDANGQLVMPGNICSHTHFYGAYSRGMAIPGDPPAHFIQILEKLWWPLDKALSRQSIEASANVCILDAIRHGTTTLFDHHASPSYIEGSLDEIYKVVELSGIRASLSYEVTDRNGIDQADAGIQENIRFANYIQKHKPLDGRVSSTFGLHASLTLSNETLEKCRKSIPDGIGFHIHVAESEADEYDSLSKYGMRIAERLDKFGILGSKSILAHCVHVDAKEMELIAKSNSWVTHQPRSNMNNAVGMAAVESMDSLGIKVCLGNDGFSNTMWDEWKAAYLAHKSWHHDPRRMNGTLVAKIAGKNNRELVHNQFGLEVGIIKPEAHADIIFVDYHPFTPITAGNLPWHILFGFNESMVTLTMVDGKILMKDHEIITMDEKRVYSEAKKLAPDVWERYQSMLKEK